MNKKNIAVLYCIMAAFFFSAMNCCVRAAGDLPFVQKSFFRNLIAFVFSVSILVKQKKSFKWKKGSLLLLVLRSVFGTAGVLCNFYAIDHLLLANASMLNKMSPFFAIVLSFIFLQERVSLVQIAGVLAAFAGSLLIIKPSPHNLDMWPSLVGLCGGFCAGAAYTAVRELGHRKEDSSRVVFFFASSSSLMLLVPVIIMYKQMNLYQVLMLSGAGLCAAGGQYSITAAYFHAPAGEISVYDYFQVVFAAVMGFFLFRQVPDMWSVLGYAVICGTAIVMFRYNNRIPTLPGPVSGSGQ